MPLLILGLFIAVPIIEIAVFIEVGGRIGLWNTVSIVIVTAMIGTWMLRSQGLKTLDSARRSMERQEFPIAELFDGICLLVAGVLLLTPGFVTDAFGFMLFMPPVRAGLRVWIWAILQRREGTRVWVDGQGPGGNSGGGADYRGGGDGNTIDGEFEIIDPEDPEDKNKPPRLPRSK